MAPYTIGAIVTFLLCVGLGALVISRVRGDAGWTAVLCILAVIYSIVAAVVWPVTLVITGATLGMMALIQAVRKARND